MCKKHGAGAPQVAEAARRRLARAEVARSLQDVEVVPIGDPLDALAELAAEAAAWKGHIGDLVGELSTLTDRTMFGDQVHVLVPLLERAMDRLQKYLSDWVRLGFEERKVRVDEIRAGLMAAVLAGVLRDLGHDPEADAVLVVIDRWLPVLDGAPAPVLDVK